MAIKEDIENAGNSTVREEIREPLMEGTKHVPEEEGQSTGNEQLWMVYLSTFVAVSGSYAFGACAGYSSPTQSAIRKDLDISLGEYSVFGSILTFGAMIGATTSGRIADFLGRKWWLLCCRMAFHLLRLGSFGFGSGKTGYRVPVFIAEIAPKNLRGALTTLHQLMICTAVSVAFIIGTVISWRALALTGLVPCAILLVGLFFIPESPRWLAKTGQHKDFQSALQKLRGKDADISHETAEIQTLSIDSQRQNCWTYFREDTCVQSL